MDACHFITPYSRFVLAKTDKLHSKLQEMSQRIRQLEDALRIAHGASGCQPHPMLEKQLLEIKACADIIRDESEDETDDDIHDTSEVPLNDEAHSAANLSNLMGSIVISGEKDAQFLGYAYGEVRFFSYFGSYYIIHINMAQ